MRTTFKLLFYVKRQKINVNNLASIYLRITVDGKRAEVSIQRGCLPERWNNKAGRMTGTKEDARGVNEYIDVLRSKVLNIHRELVQDNLPISAEVIRNKLTGVKTEKEKPRMLLEIFAFHNEQMKELIGKEYALGTWKKYKTVYNCLEKFISAKYNEKDVAIASLKYPFITDFEFYLKTVQKIGHNTAMGMIKKTKKIILQCVDNEWLDRNPFSAYKIRLRETHRLFLTEDELQRLLEKEYTIERLELVKDLFLFSCYTGLSYSDVVKLGPNDVSKGIDGGEWIFTVRTKTDIASRIPLLPNALAVIEKYKSHPKASAYKLLFPPISNQKINAYLKEIADTLGISKELTFHCARHTFATTVTLSNGVPIETVGKMLGHNNLRTTQQYAKVLDAKVSEDMGILLERLNAKHADKVKNSKVS